MKSLLRVLAISALWGVTFAAEFHVAPAGVDANAGDKTHPFATIAHAVAIAKAGDTIWLHTGIYREFIDIKTTGLEPLTIAAVPGEKPQIFGSAALVGLIKGYRSGMSPPSYQAARDGRFYGNLPIGLDPAGCLFIDDQPATLRAKLNTSEPGYALLLNPADKRIPPVIQVEFAAGDGMDEHRLEWATAHSVIVGETGACPVHLKGLDVAYANNGKQEGVVVLCSPGSVVENCVVRDSVSRGISVCPHGTVMRCHVYGHGILGIGSAGGDAKGVSGLRVTDCEIDHNAWNNADTGWEAGGVKLSSAHDAVVERNNIHDNSAWGIWFDWQCEGNRIEGNFCQRNVAGGIFLEASRHRNIIANNICIDTRQDPHNDWGDGIFSHDSSDALVTHNLCLHNAAFGIRFRLDSNRKLDDGTQVECSRNVIKNNICAGNGVAQIGLPSDGPLMRGNVSDGNVLFTETPSEKIAQACVYPSLPFYDFASWQELGFDRNSIVAKPIFRDAEHGDFSPGPDAPQTKLGPTLVGPVDTTP
jgi:parallel beta-helix repeat protein